MAAIRLQLAALAIVVLAGCKPSHEEARHFKIAERELNVPAPARDKAFDQRLEWNLETCVDAYNKIGSHDRKWDFAARGALQIMAQQNAVESVWVESSKNLLPMYLDEAAKAGCDDPLVKYEEVLRPDPEKFKTTQERNDALRDAAFNLQGSKYPPFRKFRACYNAFYAMRYVPPYSPDLQTLLDDMQADFFAALEDKDLPPAELYQGGSDYEWCIHGWTDFQLRWKPLDTILSNRWSASEATYLLRGRYFQDSAWEARGGGWAKDVSASAWKIFFERLVLAEQNLSKAAEIAPADARPATIMISVSAARQKLNDMETWFQRAMLLNPNNYDACKSKLGYLDPRWYGTAGTMLDFGRQCVASTNWAGKVPLILADAHWTLSQEAGTNVYWTPEIWPDIQASFGKFFELNPNAKTWRNNYAWYAYVLSLIHI